MSYMQNNNTVDEKLTNAGADLEGAATGLQEVLTALDAIIPCLSGNAPLKVEYKNNRQGRREGGCSTRPACRHSGTALRRRLEE